MVWHLQYEYSLRGISLITRKITTSEVHGEIIVGNYRPDTNDYGTRLTTVALKATIEPPVPGLNPEAVTRYIGSGNWQGTEEGMRPLENVLLVGSSEEATTIYAAVCPDDDQAHTRHLLAARTSELLGFMGIQTEITPI